MRVNELQLHITWNNFRNTGLIERNQTHRRLYTTWCHLYKDQKQATLTCSVGSQTVITFVGGWWWDGSERGVSGEPTMLFLAECYWSLAVKNSLSYIPMTGALFCTCSYVSKKNYKKQKQKAPQVILMCSLCWEPLK